MAYYVYYWLHKGPKQYICYIQKRTQVLSNDGYEYTYTLSVRAAKSFHNRQTAVEWAEDAGLTSGNVFFLKDTKFKGKGNNLKHEEQGQEARTNSPTGLQEEAR